MLFQAPILLSLAGLASIAASTPATTSVERSFEERENNGIGGAPTLGWNNWNAFGSSGSSASVALAAANAFVSLGLDKVGYRYVNIDDCWSQMSRNSSGYLVPDSTKWPNGIKTVADQIHSMGLKMGLYGDSGTATCSGFPGSQGYEARDANTLASWGIDYWKYDNCNTPSGNSTPRYETMSTALRGSGRNILYSICNWGADAVWTWGAGVGNSWRTSSDISDSWGSVSQIAAGMSALAQYAQPGGFNDFDMLEVGNGGLTTAEERSHFGLWALAKSPLILGCDLTKISSSSLAVISSKAVVAINQDSLGKAATYFQPSGQSPPTSNSLYPYWAGPLSDGVVVGLVAANGAATLSAILADVPGLGSGSYSWTELWSGKTGSGTSVSATLASHDMAIFKVTTGKAPSSLTTSKSSASTVTTAKPTTSTSSKSVTASSPTTTASTGSGVAMYGQCGGINWTGATVCVSGSTCTKVNDYYSQCV